MTNPLGPPARSRALILAAVLVVAASQIPSSRTPDFLQDYCAAWARSRDRPIYTPTLELAAECWPSHGFANDVWLQQTHPPLATLLTVPLITVPFEMARWLWMFVCLAALGLAWEIVGLSPLTCLATAPLWCIALVLGTHEPLLALAIAVGLRWIDRRPAIAGCSLGAAAVLKGYPAVLLLGLLVAGHRRAVAWSIGAAGLCVVMAEWCLGGGATWGWLQSISQSTHQYVDSVHNGSLVRIVRESTGGSPTLIAAGIVGLLSLPLVWKSGWLRRTGDRGAAERGRSATGREAIRAMVPVMLLASPLSWRHYVGLAGLATFNRGQQTAVAVAGILPLLIGVGVVDEVPEVLILLPLVGTLLWQWWDRNLRGVADHFDPAGAFASVAAACSESSRRDSSMP